MQTVNLKKYYYPLFTKDTFVEVSDEVAEALLHMYREDNNRNRKIYYHKAYYSLDREDGIENAAFNFVEKSPEEIMLEQEEERLFLVTLNRLSEAMENLTPLQYRRVHARYFLGMKVGEIAAVEGVGVSVVSGSLRGALASIRRYFEKKEMEAVRRMNFTKSELEMIYQYAAPTKAEPLAGLKEIVPILEKKGREL